MENSVIILYHRAPVRILQKHGMRYTEDIKPNGIIPLIKSYFANNKKGLWICCDAFENEDSIGECLSLPFNDFDLKVIPFEQDVISQFYHVSSKNGFWPIIHSFPEKYDQASIDWENFLLVNKLFADAAIEAGDENSIFWIHDYNLWMAPGFIRAALPNCKISFYHHTPFPPVDIFNILPFRNEIISSLLCCNSCNFNIPRYVENFVSTANSLFDIEIVEFKDTTETFRGKGALGQRKMTREIIYKDHTVYLDAVPEGTDRKKIAAIIKETKSHPLSARIRKIKKDKQLIFSASRVDYIKGIVEMLEAYDVLLDENDGRIALPVLCLIAVEPAKGIKSYDETYRKINELVGSINARYSTFDWTPIVFFSRQFSFEEMVIWYQEANILWIPSLRDGMNIVCKEYVITKQNSDGVLVLSEFAGAATELNGAILTNPYSIRSLIGSIKLALSMDTNERKSRMASMYACALRSDITLWSRQLDKLVMEQQLI